MFCCIIHLQNWREDNIKTVDTGKHYNHPPSSSVGLHVFAISRNLSVLSSTKIINKQLYTVNVLYIVSPNYYSFRMFAYMDATSKLHALSVAQ
jgi:hypothetical protein